MKKTTKKFSELYSPEIKDRISEAHSMIMEQAGDLNLSTLIPNWKNMKMADLIDSIVKTSLKSSEIITTSNENLSERDYAKIDYFSAKNWSSRWRSSKFGKMSPDEIGDYARSSPERRKEVRDFLEKEYQWYLKNAPEGLIKNLNISWTKKSISKGSDPFDRYYKGAAISKNIIAYTSILTLILQLLLWLTF